MEGKASYSIRKGRAVRVAHRKGVGDFHPCFTSASSCSSPVLPSVALNQAFTIQKASVRRPQISGKRLFTASLTYNASSYSPSHQIGIPRVFAGYDRNSTWNTMRTRRRLAPGFCLCIDHRRLAAIYSIIEHALLSVFLPRTPAGRFRLPLSLSKKQQRNGYHNIKTSSIVTLGVRRSLVPRSACSPMLSYLNASWRCLPG